MLNINRWSFFQLWYHLFIYMYIYLFICWKSGTGDLLVLMLFVVQCTDYKYNFVTLTLTEQSCIKCVKTQAIFIMKSSNGYISAALLTLCAGNLPVTGELTSKRPETRSFDVFFDVLLNKRQNKQSRCWWFETHWYSLWRHCNAEENPKNKEQHWLLVRGTTRNRWILLINGW